MVWKYAYPWDYCWGILKKNTDNKIEIITKTGCSCVKLLLLRRLNTKSEQIYVKLRQYRS